MSRRILVALGLLFCLTSTFAQTLFTYGKDTVTVPQFLQAYTKNNTADKNSKALQEYLNLYIASKLKIKEAKDKGYDTLPQLASDLQNLREQIMPAYLNDPASINSLIKEAVARSQKDIHLGYIFISFTNKNGRVDSTGAQQRAKEAYRQLKNGADFFTIARQFSDDPSIVTNGGDAGYITALTLPYNIENLIYQTPVNSIAPVYSTRSGYHIFKNLGERKALGRVKAAQILLAFPPGADAATKSSLQKLADSLYTRFQKGDDFGKLAALFSNDYISAAAGGVLPEFGVGQYDTLFENTVFALKDGAVSKPFTTAYGYHIVKKLSAIPVIAQSDTVRLQALREKIEQNDRIKIAQDALMQNIIRQVGFKKTSFDETELWAFSDSILDAKPVKIPLHIDRNTILFTVGKQSVSANDWISHAQVYRYRSDGSGVKHYQQVWDEFVQTVALNYYKTHLEDYNPDFRRQINEFRDGNLFFEIMQRQVWGPAQSDSAALVNYYQQHRQKYQWKESAAAVIFYANDRTVAKQLYAVLQKSPARWRTLILNTGDKVVADSNRFELAQIPNPSHLPLQSGTVTAPLLNKSDNTASFAYILKLYPQTAQRSFAEAKAMVINDYQNELDEKWINQLKAKYPVTINQKALSDLEAAK